MCVEGFGRIGGAGWEQILQADALFEETIQGIAQKVSALLSEYQAVFTEI